MIVYAEITIHKELNPETMLSFVGRMVSKIPQKTTNTIVILFDDGIIVDATKTVVSDVKITMGTTSTPVYFEIKKKTYFSRSTQLFKPHKDKLFSEEVESPYNCSYYQLQDNADVFAITRIKSSDASPRFLVAYNDTHFEKKHVMYLAKHILK